MVLGPINDMVHIVHGPIGCGYYAWGTRRNKARVDDPRQKFMNYCVSTDMQESDIVFGGEKKLAKVIDEVVDIFHPKAIAILATCPVGLIGDDMNAVARQMKEELASLSWPSAAKVTKGSASRPATISPTTGCSKTSSAPDDKRRKAEFTINILGEYNIGGDGWEIDTLLRKSAYTVVSVMTGDVVRRAEKRPSPTQPCPVPSLHQLHRRHAGNKIRHPWLKVNFVGAEAAKKNCGRSRSSSRARCWPTAWRRSSCTR